MVDLSNVSLSELAAATGNLDFGGYKGVNVADPGADQDAATKKYHDNNKYTDAEVDAIVAVHAALPSVHHTKYTDAEAKTAATTTKSRAYLGTTQTGIPNLTWTIVQLNTDDFDPDNNFDTANYRYVVPETGYYLVAYSVKWASIGTNIIIGTGIYENATPMGDVMDHYILNNFKSCGGIDVFYFTAGRYITMKAFQNSGSSQSIGWYNKASTFMVIQKLL